MNVVMLTPTDLTLMMLLASFEDAEEDRHQRKLAAALRISLGRVNKALQFCAQAQLYDPAFRRVQRVHLLEVLQSGLRFIYPATPGETVGGVATAVSAPPLMDLLGPGSNTYVWPHESGNATGQAIAPLIPGVVHAARNHPRFYEYMALVDALRVGRARERTQAREILTQRLV